MLKNYDAKMHAKGLHPREPEKVRELAGDGHEKVVMKICAEMAPKKRSGRPNQSQTKPKPYYKRQKRK